ncbi:hypothetical protein HEQ62_09735 [Haematospirillum jordaniae]|nr:hypothetical protein [Haematospirillum jordaniae]NKD45940.1 hypothetical protein [Haematospirillum jordaniae]NKD58018.1 hypothetical protein [Haematospirillum jordaniae]NKD60050.1 hypothetical protein [Haematospirillum jordaniae]NKD68015.1 hypothetical protein [Haematospirillum jordaniae]NKD80108.1 hypothetical protein [Haematospirillum jordaniae]
MVTKHRFTCTKNREKRILPLMEEKMTQRYLPTAAKIDATAYSAYEAQAASIGSVFDIENRIVLDGPHIETDNSLHEFFIYPDDVNETAETVLVGTADFSDTDMCWPIDIR